MIPVPESILNLPATPLPVPPIPHSDYWEPRKNTTYNHILRVLTENLGKRAKSVLDVGSGGCPHLDWFSHVPERFSIDAKKPYEAEGVESVTGDFLLWKPKRRFHMITCLHVLERVRRPDIFAKKLLGMSDMVVVTVPYQWMNEKSASHIHTGITEKTMLDWFGRAPNFSYVCRELMTDSHRLIQVYEKNPEPWNNLSERNQIRAEWMRKKTEAQNV